MAPNLKVCIIGAEGWGTAIAAAISRNVLELKGGFDERVYIYVHDDPMRNSLLSEVMNNRHENVKYLPGIKLPENLIAVNNLLEAAQDADILIFSIPHTFVKSYCNILAGNVKETAFAVSMVKGLMQERDDEMMLVSETITEGLDIPCYSMMSAQSSMEMAQEKLCEVTVGCDDAVHAQLLTAVLQTKNCRVISINDVTGVELCGTLNEIINLGAGFVDGLRLGDNTRVAAIHLCVKEMMRFIKTFFPSAQMSTFYETCGIANSVAATYVDKNVHFAESFIKTGKTFEEMEAAFLHGRKLLGPLVAAEVNAFLEKALMQHEYPLFTAIHQICQNKAPPELMLDALRNHPDLSSSSISHLLSKETAPVPENMDQLLDQVADALPKLRSCLDKILIEANSPNFNNLKVMDDWVQVDEHKFETGFIPSRLGSEASKIREEIQKGNVQVAFKMDASEGGRHLRLLLQELPEQSTSGLVISSDSELGQGHVLDSSTQYIAKTGSPTENAENDSPDVLNLSSENTSEPMEPEISGEANLQIQDNLIKSIRETIEALGNKEKMDNLIAESRLEDENLPFARLQEDKNQSPDEATEMRQPEMEAGPEALNEHMLSDSEQQSLQREQENPVELCIHDDVEAALIEVPVIDYEDPSFTNEKAELEELQWEKLEIEPDEDSPKLSEFGDPAAWETIAKHVTLSDMDTAELSVGNRKPNLNLNNVHVRHFRDKKTDGAGHHEWDWMLNRDIDTDEPQAKDTDEPQPQPQSQPHSRDETLSKSDQAELDKLNVQLQEALQRDLDKMLSSHEDAPNQELEQDKDLETESGNKRITHEPSIPLPLKFPTPKKHYREGTPEIQNQPGSVPPPKRESKPNKPKKMQPLYSNPPIEFGEMPEAINPEATFDQLEPESKMNYKTELTSAPPSEGKSEAARPSAEKRRSAQETNTRSDGRTASRPGKESNSVARKNRQVDFRGKNPFAVDPDLESKLSLDTSHNRDMGEDGPSHQRRKVVVSPPFMPPLNPRVRVPRPPFDARDREYHTMIARPAINWLSSRKPLKLPLVAAIQVKQLAAMPRQVPFPSPSLLQIPSGMPRTSMLTKILCALQIGLLASYLARSKKNCYPDTRNPEKL